MRPTIGIQTYEEIIAWIDGELDEISRMEQDVDRWAKKLVFEANPSRFKPFKKYKPIRSKPKQKERLEIDLFKSTIGYYEYDREGNIIRSKQRMIKPRDDMDIP